MFLTFVVVIGTLLLHGLTLPWLIRRLGVQGDDERTDAIAAAAAQERAAAAAAVRLDELLADTESPAAHERAAEVLRAWNNRRRNSAWERLGRQESDMGESPTSTFRRLRLEMLAAEREALVAERDSGRIDDEVLRSMLHGWTSRKPRSTESEWHTEPTGEHRVVNRCGEVVRRHGRRHNGWCPQCCGEQSESLSSRLTPVVSWRLSQRGWP